MSSPNGPIIQQILDKLSGIGTRLENLESQMTDVHAYIRKKESIQKAAYRQKFISACDTRTMTQEFKEFLLR
jgi:hypothetical protein